MNDFDSNFIPPPPDTPIPNNDPGTSPFDLNDPAFTYDATTQGPPQDAGTSFPTFDVSSTPPVFDATNWGPPSFDTDTSFLQDNTSFADTGFVPDIDGGHVPPDFGGGTDIDSGFTANRDFFPPPDIGITPLDVQEQFGGGGADTVYDDVPFDISFDQGTMGPPVFDDVLSPEMSVADNVILSVDGIPSDAQSAVHETATSSNTDSVTATDAVSHNAADTGAVSTTDTTTTQSSETTSSSNANNNAQYGTTAQTPTTDATGGTSTSDDNTTQATEKHVWGGGLYERGDGTTYTFQRSESFVRNGEVIYQNTEARADGTTIVHEYRESEGFNVEHSEITHGPDPVPPAPSDTQVQPQTDVKFEPPPPADSSGIGKFWEALDTVVNPNPRSHPFARGAMDNLSNRGAGIASNPLSLWDPLFRPDKVIVGMAQPFITLGKAADDTYYYVMHPDSTEAKTKAGGALVDFVIDAPNVVSVGEMAYGGVAGAGVRPGIAEAPTGNAVNVEASPAAVEKPVTPSVAETSGPAATVETVSPESASTAPAATEMTSTSTESVTEPPSSSTTTESAGTESNAVEPSIDGQGEPPVEPPSEPGIAEEPVDPQAGERELNDAGPEPKDAEPEPHDADPEPHDVEQEPHDADRTPDAETKPMDVDSEANGAESENTEQGKSVDEVGTNDKATEPSFSDRYTGPESGAREVGMGKLKEGATADVFTESATNENSGARDVVESNQPVEGPSENPNSGTRELSEHTQESNGPSENPNSGVCELPENGQEIGGPSENPNSGARGLSDMGELKERGPALDKSGKPFPAERVAKAKFGEPSTENSGTDNRTGMHFNERNALEIAQDVKTDYDPVAGRIRSVEGRVDAGTRQRTGEVNDRLFGKDTSTAGPQPSKDNFTNTGEERGHLYAREAAKENAMPPQDHIPNRNTVPENLNPQVASDKSTNVVPMDRELNQGADWRNAERQTMELADQHGSVRLKLELGYAESPSRLPNGTPIPETIHRTVYGPEGQILQDIVFLNDYFQK